MMFVVSRRGGSYFLTFSLLICWLTIGPAQAETVRIQLKEPGLNAYDVDAPAAQRGGAGPEWIAAHPKNGSTNSVVFSRRVFLKLQPGTDLGTVLAGSSLKADRQVTSNVFIVQAPDAWVALQEAQRLAQRADVEASTPIAQRPRTLHTGYAAKPNDEYIDFQKHLESRSSDGTRNGADINVRAAWAYTRGEGVVLALADDGVEMTHPDLAGNATGPHMNFGTGLADGNHPVTGLMHGTCVSGLMAAVGNNSTGVSGVAPKATFASWVVFTNTGANGFVSDEKFMDMYMFKSNVVSVQNHSWGNEGSAQEGMPATDDLGIGLAIANGRNGLGTVMVRSGGNDRDSNANSNDDGFTADPRVITTAAVRQDGRASSYSEPGANLLVAAPGGDFSPYTGLFTTDRLGTLGYDFLTYPTDADRNNYVAVFIGTSGAAPLVSGISALVLSVNPNLTYRDVQHIVLNAGVQFDTGDPDLTTNGAGYVVSHNTGFGVPDAGWAVQLAKGWSNRPARVSVSFTNSVTTAIPDDGLLVTVSDTQGGGSPVQYSARPGEGLHPDVATANLPLVNVGQAITALTTNLTGKAALIQRGGATFPAKVQNAADAGAAFVVMYNNDSALPYILGDTDYSPIPVVMIEKTNGEAIVTRLASTPGSAVLQLNSATKTFNVTNTLVCEHVQLKVTTDHPVRGDLRITLTSPQGTVSVLEALNGDVNPGPTNWTYLSTHHFYESTAGNWKVAVTDEQPGDIGNLKEVVLTLHGVPIVDTDHDGLDDNWELAHFGNLAQGPRDDPDGDGSNNAREQLLGTDPMAKDVPFKIELAAWNNDIVRLTWPGATNHTYQVYAGTNVAASLPLLTNIAGRFPETEFMTYRTNLSSLFYRIGEATP